MNKTELVEKVSEALDSTKKDAKEAVDAVLNGIADGIEEDGKVSIMRFGSFTVKTRKARKGRNPQTGDPLDIPATQVVGFKPGSGLKETAKLCDFEAIAARKAEEAEEVEED